jgi:hypothetical protein
MEEDRRLRELGHNERDETVSGFLRSRGAMTPPCPVCEEPMKERGRTFQCEPCRQIVIFFTVSDASPYIALALETVKPNEPSAFNS